MCAKHFSSLVAHGIDLSDEEEAVKHYNSTMFGAHAAWAASVLRKQADPSYKVSLNTFVLTLSISLSCQTSYQNFHLIGIFHIKIESRSLRRLAPVLTCLRTYPAMEAHGQAAKSMKCAWTFCPLLAGFQVGKPS
jgi:hypothetical protein